MTDRSAIDERDPAFEQRLAAGLGRLADEADVLPLPDLTLAPTPRSGRASGARRIVAAAAVVIVVLGLAYAVTRGDEPATISTADSDGTETAAAVTTEPAVPTTERSSTTVVASTSSTSSAPPPTTPSGVPIDDGIAVDAQLRPRMGDLTIEIFHPDTMPLGTAALAFRINGQMVEGGAYVPGQLSGQRLDELDGESDGTITLSIIARRGDGEPIAESAPVTIEMSDLMSELMVGHWNDPVPRVDPTIVVDAHLTRRMGARFLEIRMPDDGPEGTEWWEIRINGRTTGMSSGSGGTAGINVDHFDPGSTIAVTLVTRSADMTPIAESEPVQLTVDD